MAELQPPIDAPANGGAVTGAPASLPAEPIAGPTKRQRRPSVRLGEIGDQHTYDNHKRSKQPQQQWKLPSKASKTRQIMEYQETLDGAQDKPNHNPLDSVAIGSWKVRDSTKSKRGFSVTKRVRSNWEKFEEEDDYDDNDGFRDFDREGSGSQLKDQSLNMSMDYANRSRDGVRVRVSDGVELDGPSDTDARNWNNNNPERNGVRVWLNQLGLGRYAPVFEVHEVDDEVLPLLTLEDLKDMGINAVGSRRKMFCSIQKLGKGFS